MGKLYGLCDLRIGKVGNLVFRKVENKNIISEKPKYYPVNSAWLTREEFKQYVLSLLNVGIPQIYALSELPEDLYDYALIFLQTDDKCLVYLDKDGTRTLINLGGGSDNYDAVDIVNNIPQNPRNNTIYIKNNEDTVNDKPTYTMYVCENDTLTEIDFGNKTVTASLPLEIDDNNNISLNYNATQFILKNNQLAADPIINLIDNKQDKLVSGVNIRTIGGNSLVNESLMRQDIEPSDIMSLEKPLKWDINDSYKVKLGFNSNDFELDSDDNLKIKSSTHPVVGAVSPLYIDSNKKVNIGIINGKGLKVASNNLQLGVNAPLYEASGNQLAFNYNTSHFSILNNKLDGKPLKDLIDKNTTAITKTSRLVGIFHNNSTQTTSSNAWKSLKLSSSNNVNTDYCELLGDRILFNKNSVYKITITCRLNDSIGDMTPLCWTLGFSGSDDTVHGGDWVASVQRHKSTQTFVLYKTKSEGAWPRVYVENSAKNCLYVQVVLEAM